MVDRIKTLFEKRAFGVCEWWGNKLGIDSSRIRVYFIYASFVTLGSPLIVYLPMAFLVEHKEKIKFWKRRKTVWDI